MRRLARRDALLGQADAAELQGRSGENPRHAAHGDEPAERPARGRNGRRDQPPLRAHGAGVHEDPVRAARRQAGREPRPAARGVARAGSRLCVTRRTWLFVPGADQAAHRGAARSGADVIVHELEDFTPPELRPKARSLSPRTLELWRKAGAIPAVRINPLQSGGLEDLMGVLAARPQIIMMAKVALPEQATGGAVELVPNVESAEGLLRAYQIAKASKRVSALLVASEDMVADLGTRRSRSGRELAYVRARFLVECRAAGVEAIDCPYTF